MPICSNAGHVSSPLFFLALIADPIEHQASGSAFDLDPDYEKRPATDSPRCGPTLVGNSRETSLPTRPVHHRIDLTQTILAICSTSRKCPLWVKSGHVRCKRSCLLYPRKRHQMPHMGMSAKGQ